MRGARTCSDQFIFSDTKGFLLLSPTGKQINAVFQVKSWIEYFAIALTVTNIPDSHPPQPQPLFSGGETSVFLDVNVILSVSAIAKHEKKKRQNQKSFFCGLRRAFNALEMQFYLFFFLFFLFLICCIHSSISIQLLQNYRRISSAIVC